MTTFCIGEVVVERRGLWGTLRSYRVRETSDPVECGPLNDPLNCEASVFFKSNELMRNPIQSLRLTEIPRLYNALA